VSVGIGSGTDGGVSRGGFGVGVVVVAIGEPCALVHEEIEAAVFELSALPVEVVTAKLIDDDDDDEFGFADVGLSVNGTRRGYREEDDEGDCEGVMKRARQETGAQEHAPILNSAR